MQAMIEREELAVIGQIAMEARLFCLGDVLRKGLEYGSLYLSSASQINDLAAPVSPMNVKGEMSDWRFLSFQLTHPTQTRLELILIGQRGPNSIVTMTSQVMAIDFVQGLVRTRNSVYRIRMDARGVGEPPAKHLIAVCRTLWSRGLGHAFGIPLV